MKLNVNEVMKKTQENQSLETKESKISKKYEKKKKIEIIANFLKGKFEVLIIEMPFVCHLMCFK